MAGNYEEALMYYEKAEKVWKKQLPQNYYFLAKCQYATGIVYSEKSSNGEDKQYGRVLEYYKKALESYKMESKSSGKEIARCKRAIGETYLMLERRGDAIQYLKESNDVHSATAKKSKYEQMKRYHHLGKLCRKESHFEIGCIYRDLRLPQDAMPYLEKALSIC